MSSEYACRNCRKPISFRGADWMHISQTEGVRDHHRCMTYAEPICDHKGVGLPGCPICDPEVRERMKATPAFVAALVNPPEPNERLREAFERHSDEVISRD